MMSGDDLDQRHFDYLVLGFDLAEDGCLLELHPNIQSDTDQNDADQERNTPSPAEEIRVRPCDSTATTPIAARSPPAKPNGPIEPRSPRSRAGAFSTPTRTAPPHPPPMPMPWSRRKRTS